MQIVAFGILKLKVFLIGIFICKSALLYVKKLFGIRLNCNLDSIWCCVVYTIKIYVIKKYMILLEVVLVITIRDIGFLEDIITFKFWSKT